MHETYALYCQNLYAFHYVINGKEYDTREKARNALLAKGVSEYSVDNHLEFLENVNFRVRG